MTSNLDLWHSVERTDPAHVKPITGKAYSGNSPKPHWLVLKATETFGPVGIGWGFTVDERIEDGAMIEPGFYEKLHIAKVKIWFEWNGKRGEVEHIGGTTFSGKRKDGKIYSDEDAPKKSVTDALVKALSMIGFAGDIFLGRWDDSRYVREVAQEFRDQAKPTAGSVTFSSSPKPSSDPLFESAKAYAHQGTAPLMTHLRSLSREHKDAIRPRLIELELIADNADAMEPAQ